MLAIRNPPPPMLPLPDEVTARAKPTATAASIAFPPFLEFEYLLEMPECLLKQPFHFDQIQDLGLQKILIL